MGSYSAGVRAGGSHGPVARAALDRRDPALIQPDQGREGLLRPAGDRPRPAEHSGAVIVSQRGRDRVLEIKPRRHIPTRIRPNPAAGVTPRFTSRSGPAQRSPTPRTATPPTAPHPHIPPRRDASTRCCLRPQAPPGGAACAPWLYHDPAHYTRATMPNAMSLAYVSGPYLWPVSLGVSLGLSSSCWR